MKDENIVLHIPECEKCGRVSGRIEHYDLIVTDARVIGARAGRNSLVASGILASISPDGENGPRRIAAEDIDRILALDRNNFSVPLSDFKQIDVMLALGQPYIRFRLNGATHRPAGRHAVPRELGFAVKYMTALQEALGEVAGA